MMPRDTYIGILLILSLAVVCPSFAPPPFEPPRPQIVAVEKIDSKGNAPTVFDDCALKISAEAWEADNVRFYEHLTVPQFVGRTATCGMHEFPDLLVPRMQQLLGVGKGPGESPQVLVEVGGGMGRVINYVADNTQIPVIISVERSKRYAVLLRRIVRPINQREGYERITVFSTDLLEYLKQSKRRNVVDVVTWLWWGFAEVHTLEKPIGLQFLHQVLKPGGTLVIDMPISPVVPTAITEYHTDFIDFRMSNEPDAPTLHLHRFSSASLNRLTVQAGFVPTGCEEYTANSKPSAMRRSLCFFNKPLVLD